MANEIGRKIKQRREQLGLTQAQVAARGGASQAFIAQVECGSRKNVTVDTLRLVANGLGCKIADLLPDEDKHPAPESRAA
ncbi:helix-turn-helix domain-containing protein [Methylomagnum ishizawai]|uniref:helix-turn-helix domain-containing protein n=1 Tax=Methylomagnum ishizawai TaxID=1760988 RepID=UPI001C335685|nr:helix-turn-helix domain-containing protein [Methylomagnum ishizawai]BBL77544.1 hypothetical protein MishRS11D_46420 [Methylomagnum ishizawai]